MQRFSNKLRPALQKLKPYVAGKGIGEIAHKYGIPEDRIVKLGSNENPYGPSPAVMDAITKTKMELYPEPEEFVSAVSRYIGYDEEQIVIGTGMDGVIDTLARLFLDPGNVSVIRTPTFSYYGIVTQLCDATPKFVNLDESPDVLIENAKNANIIFLCSPNNPTGGTISEGDLRCILECCNSIVFLDEAYVEFANKSLVGLVQEYENLVVGRTMSKAFGLAGLRLGYAVVPEWIANEYRRAAPPFFGVSVTSVAAGTAAMNDLPYMKRSVEAIVTERQRLFENIAMANPSEGNFLYIETKETSGVVAESFLRKGIIIRDCYSFRGAGDNHIRVTVGTKDQNDRFLEAYQSLCK